MVKHKHKLEGQEFGKLTVLSRAEDRGIKVKTKYLFYPAWNCRCDCGNETVVLSSNLLTGISKSCGCTRTARRYSTKHYIDLLGQEFGKWKVIAFDAAATKHNRSAYWICECSCGRQRSVGSASLRKGLSKNCGGPGCKVGGQPQLGTLHAKHHILYNYQWNANKKGNIWALLDDNFYALIKQNCHYCGQPPSTLRKIGKVEYLYNGVDRVDNSKGYEIGNVVPCCKVCNSAKNTMTVEEFYAWVERVWNKKNQ